MVKNFILSSKVFHKRHLPKQNSFRYRSYYVILDMLQLNQNKTKLFSINKPNLYSFYDKDHGLRDGSSSLKWATDLLNQYKLEYDDIKLMTMPRVLGYLFNPVSFWLCYKNNKLIAVIAEVNNTFKETHSYICHKNGQDITNKCWFKAEKIFHVSPFYPRQGFYKFNFALNFENSAKNQIIINYYDNDQLQLGTAISGNMKPLSSANLIKEFIRSPLLTFKVIYLIHWQALKIVFKKIKYIPKPIQQHDRISVAKFINL
ncbi:DUF1365 domain-containing protein [Francisella hispaniensis]|uniref:DUF1365 domain-containing protein n=1 Tax=Francisella hispaniensis TaxID=622488 RepID=F4BH81_9GAMM|nr:DUF1365 domain-containing protein [Francisella hispaniensis]AEE26825.1 Hypothetical protein FN3523_1522 [Francisella hispaniensis]